MSLLSVTPLENQPLPDFEAPYGALPHQPYPVEKYQWRAKVQPFSAGGYEVTAKLVDVEKVAKSVEAGMYGFVRGTRTESISQDREADIIKATQRAKRQVRLTCKEMGANRLLTLTTRQTMPLDSLLAIWQTFVPMVERALGGKFFYLAVPEPHPSNPAHLHLHVAVNVFLPVHTLRRCWHAAVATHIAGVRGNTSAIMRGKHAPGNVDLQYIRAKGQGEVRSKVAKYISKYITKDCLQRFNRKRYWASKGSSLLECRQIWLKARNNGDVIDELRELGLISDVIKPQKTGNLFFAPSRELVWYNHVTGEPDNSPPPF